MSEPRLCDQPGCDEPATHIDQAEARNTGTKEWFACDAHRATPPRPVPDFDALRATRPVFEGTGRELAVGAAMLLVDGRHDERFVVYAVAGSATPTTDHAHMVSAITGRCVVCGLTAEYIEAVAGSVIPTKEQRPGYLPRPHPWPKDET